MQNSKSIDILKVSGDGPLARFGHTMTFVSKSKAVLFGGATGDNGKYQITDETYLFDCKFQKWRKLEPSGSAPTQRAAHAATAVDNNQVMIYGGATGGGSLAPDDLYLLDFRSGEELAQWIVVPVIGTTPGRRYGHTLAYSKPFLIVFGGNTGSETVNDLWILNTEKPPLYWTKLELTGDIPMARVYHSVTVSQNGNMMIFGGRAINQNALNDAWELRRYRDGAWEWVELPYKSAMKPMGRYQHSTLTYGSKMLVIGGRTNNVNEAVPLEVYDSDSGEWGKMPSIERFRHACWILDDFLYIHGGFEQESPNIPTDTIAKMDLSLYLKPAEPKTLYENTNNVNNMKTTATNQQYRTTFDPTRRSDGNENPLDITVISKLASEPLKAKPKKPATAGPGKVREVRLSENVWVVTPQQRANGKEIIQKFSIENLPEESRKLTQGFLNNKGGRSLYYESIYLPFVTGLIKPPRGSFENKFIFKKDQIHKLIDECINLFENPEEVPTVLKLKVPVKVFGSIHGQYGDLLRLFENWGAPTDEGDIESFDYLFLGNYVDRGRYNLEILCLLFSLKLKYPDSFHLLRGNHEDIRVNKNLGFGEECASRLGEDINDPKSVFQKFNKLFEYLPLAAMIQNRILCVHSGIGNTLQSVQELETISRPIEIVQESSHWEHRVLYDLVWSDPAQGNNVVNQQNKIAYGMRTSIQYSQERLNNFLGENGLSMLVRSHECVTDGFEKNWNGMLMTVFSATDYSGKASNAAAVMVVRKNWEITPKVIYTSKTTGKIGLIASSEEGKFGKSFDMMGSNQPNQIASATMGHNHSWIDHDENAKKRTSTPPRYVTKGSFKK